MHKECTARGKDGIEIICWFAETFVALDLLWSGGCEWQAPAGVDSTDGGGCEWTLHCCQVVASCQG